MDTRRKVFDWVDRGCVTKKNKCKNGTVTKSFIDVDFLDLSDATDYDVEVSIWLDKTVRFLKMWNYLICILSRYLAVPCWRRALMVRFILRVQNVVESSHSLVFVKIFKDRVKTFGTCASDHSVVLWINSVTFALWKPVTKFDSFEFIEFFTFSEVVLYHRSVQQWIFFGCRHEHARPLHPVCSGLVLHLLPVLINFTFITSVCATKCACNAVNVLHAFLV